MKKANFDRGQFQVAYQELFSKIKKFMDRQFKVVEEMKLDSFYTETKKGVEELDDAENLLQCYQELFNTKPETEKELEQISWLFNGGRLRSNQEVSVRNEALLLEQKKAELPFKRILLNMSQAAWDYRLICLSFALAPVLPFIIAYKSAKGHAMFADIFFFTYDIAYVFSLLLSWGIAGGIIFLTNNHTSSKINRLYIEAGEKPPFPTGAVISGAAYALFLATLFKKKRK